MGGLVSSLGLGEGGGETGSAGTKFAASGIGLQLPTTNDQAQTAYAQTQAGLAQQQAFVQALQAQNGIGNQSNVYNQLSGIVAGTGPNPAQAALNQATGANVANQAALMAGQRGAGANTGLIARQAGMQGGALQQQAVGQGATMQAQQALNALNMQGGIATQQVGQQAGATQAYNAAAQGQQQNILGAINGQNNANVTMRGNQNNVNGQLANTVAQGQQALAGNVMKAAGAAVAGLAHGGQVPHYDAGGIAMPVANSFQMPAFGASLQGTPVAPTLQEQVMTTEDANQPQSNVGKFHKSKDDGSPLPQGYGGAYNPGAAALQQGSADFSKGLGHLAGKIFSGGQEEPTMAGGPMDATNAPGMGGELAYASKGGKVPAMLSPGEMYLPPEKAEAVAEKRANPMQEGQRIPGKAKVKGDNLKNDTVPATLESGGVVIPRSIMESKDAAKKAAAFVTEHLRKTRKTLPSKG